MSHGFLADEFYHCPRVASFGAVSSNVPCTVAELGRMGMNREYRLSTSGVDPKPPLVNVGFAVPNPGIRSNQGRLEPSDC
jgi:hypothetical protein